MSNEAFYACLGALWMLSLLLVARASFPMLQKAWARLNHRRDILDPPVGIYLVNDDGSRQQLFAEFAGRQGWLTRVWFVTVPDELAQQAMAGQLHMHIDQAPNNSAVI